VNTITGLGEEVNEYIIFQKVIRSLPMIFDHNISAIEERTYMDLISMDEIHGIFTTYEMRTEQENLAKRINIQSIKEVKTKGKGKGKSKEKQQ
jgi:hypothetical protein